MHRTGVKGGDVQADKEVKRQVKSERFRASGGVEVGEVGGWRLERMDWRR